jgi:hypothetical protein
MCTPLATAQLRTTRAMPSAWGLLLLLPLSMATTSRSCSLGSLPAGTQQQRRSSPLSLCADIALLYAHVRLHGRFVHMLLHAQFVVCTQCAGPDMAHIPRLDGTSQHARLLRCAAVQLQAGLEQRSQLLQCGSVEVACGFNLHTLCARG